MADKSRFVFVTYHESGGNWRGAITPDSQSGLFIRGRTTTSFVTPDHVSRSPMLCSKPKRLFGCFR